MKKTFARLFAVMMVLSLTACSSTSGNLSDQADQTKNTVYAVEAGSAGEAAALENGFTVNSVDTQAKALMEVQAGTSDAAIIDSLMAGAMVGEGTSYPNLIHTGCSAGKTGLSSLDPAGRQHGDNDSLL